MNFLVIEDALKDHRGHWVKYVSTFALELRALGDVVDILCDQNAEDFIIQSLGARPILPESIWHRMGDKAGVLKRYLRVPGHAYEIFLSVRKILKRNILQPQTNLNQYPSISPKSFDWIFIPTVLVHHLLAWWLLLKTGSLPRSSRVLLFFPNLPVKLDNSDKPHWIKGPTTKLMAWLFKKMSKEVVSGKVVLGVETHAMRRALEKLINLPVVYLPHPVSANQGQEILKVEARELSYKTGVLAVAERPKEKSENRNAETLNDLHAGNSKLDSEESERPIVFGCYGAARWEKGSDIFQEAIKLILLNKVAVAKWRESGVKDNAEPQAHKFLPATSAGRPLHFVIQWVEDFRDGAGNLVSISSSLLQHSQVEVIGRYFEGSEYEKRLAETDVMVLPYRSPYQLRVSRVAIEAIINGIPVIATRGTTLFEQAQEYGEAVSCDELTPEGLAAAILEAAERVDAMRWRARKKANLATESFSVKFFRNILLNLKPSFSE